MSTVGGVNGASLTTAAGIESLIQQTMAVQRTPVTKMKTQKDELLVRVAALNSTLQRIGTEVRATEAGRCTKIKNKMLELTSKSIAITNTNDDVELVGAIVRDIGPISTMTTEVLNELASSG